jgi:hypothetical protein
MPIVSIPLSDGVDTSKVVGENPFEGVAETISLKSVVLFEDDFRDNSLDPGWNYTDTSDGDIFERNGRLEIRGGTANNGTGIIRNSTIAVIDGSEASFTITPNDNTSAKCVGFSEVATVDITKIIMLAFTTGGGQIRTYINGAFNVTGYNYIVGRTYNCRIKRRGGVWEFYIQSDDDTNYLQEVPIKFETYTPASSNLYPGVIPFVATASFSYVNDFVINNGLYPTDSPSPADEWTDYPVGTVITPSTFFIFENNHTGDAGTLKYKIASNGGADSAFLTQTQLRALGPITITNPTQSIKLSWQGISDGSQKTTSSAVALVDATFPVSGDQAAESDVRLGVVYDNSTKTGTAAIPGASDVRDGVAVDATTGTAAIPGPDDVRVNVPVDDTIGNYVPADEDKYAQNQQYGSNGTEFTGTKTVTQFETPVEIILEDPEILIFEGDI